MKSYDVTIQMKAIEQYFPVVLYYAVQGGSNFWVCGWNPTSVTIQMKATEQYFPAVLYYAVQGGSNN